MFTFYCMTTQELSKAGIKIYPPMIDAMKSALISAMKPFNFALWIILSVVLTVAGPFGTFETASFGLLLFYWTTVVIVSSLLGYQSAYISRYLTKRRHPLLTDLVGTAVMVLTFTPFNTYFTQATVINDPADRVGLVEMGAYVAGIAFAILSGRRLIPGLEEQNYLPRSHDSNQPRLLRRLPQRDRARVLRISSQDHFVDIVTEKGSTRLRMRLVDAIDEMDGVSGYCTHRSHWVAESAISLIHKDKSKPVVQLENGDQVPISRKYKPDLEKAGLF